MANFKLEFVGRSSEKCNNFSEGSSEPKEDAQVIRVQGAQKLELLVTTNIIPSTWHDSHNVIVVGCRCWLLD